MVEKINDPVKLMEVINKQLKGFAEKGLSKADARKEVSKLLKDQKGVTLDEFEDQVKTWSNVTLQVLQGASRGGSDEAIAYINSLIGDESYDDALKKQRQNLEVYRAASPVKSALYEGGGAIASALAEAALTRRRKPLTRIPSIARRMLGAGTRGGAEGAIYGFLTGEGDAKSRMQNVTLPSLFGAGGGIVGQTVSDVATPLARAVGSQLGIDPNILKARNIIRKAVGQDSETVENIITKAKSVAPQQADEMRLGDLTESLRGQTQALATSPTEGRPIIKEALKGRELNVGQRIDDTFSELIDTPLEESIEAEIPKIVARKRAESKPLYQAAEEQIDLSFAGMKDLPEALRSKLANVLLRPSVRKYLKDAKIDLKNLNKKDLANEKINWAKLDQVKKNLDDEIKSLLRNGKTQKARVTQQVKDDLLEIMDDARIDPQGFYRQARSVFENESKIQEALESGYDFFRARSRRKTFKVKTLIKDMSETEKQAFVRGVAYSVKDLAAESPDTANLARNILRGTRKELIKDLFGGDTAAYNRFINNIDNELSMFETSSVALRGSRTEPLEQEAELLKKRLGSISEVRSVGDLATALLRIVFQDSTESTLPARLADELMIPVKDIPKIRRALKGKLGEDIITKVEQLKSTSLPQTGSALFRQQAPRNTEE